jgi:hypothetical protein
MKKLFFLILVICSTLVSCISTKSTLKNVDNTAPKPVIKNNAFVITENTPEAKYGYHQDYPINLGFENEKLSEKNISLFFNALLGKENQNFTYKKLEDCCPFPSKRNVMGAGMLSVYEITFQDMSTAKLYINLFERGKVYCPKGFHIK